MMHVGRARVLTGFCFAIAFAITLPGCKREDPPPPATAPTSQPATAPATKPAEVTYVDVLRVSHPKLPATQPLAVPVDLRDAGHFILNDPVYVCPRGDLWVTSPQAPPMAETLVKAPEEQTHVVPEPIAYVQWIVDEGKWLARPVVRQGSTCAWIDHGVRRAMTAGRGYRWDNAILFGESVVVPTDRGISIFAFTPKFEEQYREFAPAGGGPPCALLDARGVLAWSPWDGKAPGGRGAARFVDGKWIELGAEQRWPEKLLHLVPLLDGSVLQLYREAADGPVKLAMGTLDAPAVDEPTINKLVEQLSDDDPDKRNAAYEELTRYGTGSWPVLEKLMEDQPPEARLRIQDLLANRLAPTLGGRLPIDGNMTVAARFADSGLLLHLPAGVSIPQGQNKPPQIVKPAWISIRPGQSIEMLEKVLTQDANPAKQRFYAFGDEWVVSDDVQGPRRLLGNHLEALLKKEEVAFNHVVGFDRRGRWLFRKSADSPQKLTPQTLMIDPTIPDDTPHLPVWIVGVQAGLVGWTKQDYPAIKGSSSLVRTLDAWALNEHGWIPVDPATDTLISQLPGAKARPVAPAGAPPVAPRVVPPVDDIQRDATTKTSTTTAATTTSATTAGTTTAATTQRTLGPPLLTDADGRRYYDGKDVLVVIDRDGNQIEWTLPPNAVGEDPVTLIRTADGLLFLFNQAGRIVRIKPTPGAAEPFVVEAVFTHRIPTDKTMRRIWLDPAGRIIMMFAENKLAILFPEGRIPPEIATLIPAKELD
jgi:hypothetical protein